MSKPSHVRATVNVDLEVIATVHPGTTSITSGPPDAWEQGEGPQVEIHSIEYSGMRVVFQRDSKAELTTEQMELPDDLVRAELEQAVMIQASRDAEWVEDEQEKMSADYNPGFGGDDD